MPSSACSRWRQAGRPGCQYSFASATFAMAAGRAALRKEGGEGGGAEPGPKQRQRWRQHRRSPGTTFIASKIGGNAN